ncbi:hypothetical protein J6590_073755 [Homalodisca vitripennis]|nr:hypothetical protein J6590_073755 [Homalodisca vitripennis]
MSGESRCPAGVITDPPHIALCLSVRPHGHAPTGDSSPRMQTKKATETVESAPVTGRVDSVSYQTIHTLLYFPGAARAWPQHHAPVSLADMHSRSDGTAHSWAHAHGPVPQSHACAALG